MMQRHALRVGGRTYVRSSRKNSTCASTSGCAVRRVQLAGGSEREGEASASTFTSAGNQPRMQSPPSPPQLPARCGSGIPGCFKTWARTRRRHGCVLAVSGDPPPSATRCGTRSYRMAAAHSPGARCLSPAVIFCGWASVPFGLGEKGFFLFHVLHTLLAFFFACDDGGGR